MIILGLDTETFLIGPGSVVPRLVCLTQYCEGELAISANGDPSDGLGLAADSLFGLLTNPDGGLEGTAHNLAFDLTVLAAYRPALFPLIFRALELRRLHCTVLREKLLNLTTTGDLEFYKLPNGSSIKIDYHLDGLVKHYLGIDISESKHANDSWRLNYSQLDGMPVVQWPADAVSYAVDDAKYHVLVFEAQEQRRRTIIAERGFDPFETEGFRVAVDFCLRLMTAWGMAVSPMEVLKLTAQMEDELTPEKLGLLIEHGIIIPAKPGTPYANGAKEHRADCPSGGKGQACNCPPKMSKDVPERKDMTALRSYVLALAAARPNDFTLKYTKPTSRFPEGQLQIDADWRAEHWALDPVLAQLEHREALQKMVTTEIPRMCWLDAQGNRVPAPVVHPCYDALKKTGRTSSYADKLFPSFNGQNVDPRARGAFVAREDNVLFSIDYSAMELGTLGQRCLDLFGHSVLADTINAGRDPHVFLGSQLAYALDSNFSTACAEGGADSTNAIFEAFADCKKAESEEVRAFFKHYRTFAKPTGLGYPGGLGPKTFCAYAKGSFGVDVDIETATRLRDLWKQTYPEMVEYFNLINHDLKDPWNERPYTDDDGERHVKTLYQYATPFGLVRAGCDYCACANGLGLQAPSAEGALTALFNIVRACYDWTMGSILYRVVKPILFVHDEIIGEMPDDDMKHERVVEMQRIMVEAMQIITPQVRAGTSACLMRRWDKAAEPVFDDNGRLQVWTPAN